MISGWASAKRDSRGRGQRDATRPPLEKTHTEHLLQKADLVTDCGRCHGQFFRAPLEAQVTGGGLEGA